MSKSRAIVVGAGVVGLATARALSLKGYSVTVIERSKKAVGASVRNFGMIWPIGQPQGIMYNRAMRSKQIWKEIADSIGMWYNESGSLHVAYRPDEWEVLQELYASFKAAGHTVALMTKNDILSGFDGIKGSNLLGGLYSDTEMVVDPRDAIASVPDYLNEYLDVSFIFGKTVTAVYGGKVYMGNEVNEADLIVICSGADFESLFPDIFTTLPITKCKLQMMRFRAMADTNITGTSICGGLSLIHYNSFQVAPSLPLLKKRYEEEMGNYLQLGIHVMVSQNSNGELTVGDSHEYGLDLDPFNDARINRLILDYLKQFMVCEDWTLTQSWNGIYPKMTNGATELFLNPEPGIYILNGLGGAGMTLSFGLAEEMVNKM